MNETKKSQTEKRYEKYLGKLFWELDSQWNQKTEQYEQFYVLHQVIGVSRKRWNKRFVLTCLTLGTADKTIKIEDYYSHRTNGQYTRNAKDFEDRVKKAITLVLSTPEQPGPPLTPQERQRLLEDNS